jgi:hypothetical protein
MTVSENGQTPGGNRPRMQVESERPVDLRRAMSHPEGTAEVVFVEMPALA